MALRRIEVFNAFEQFGVAVGTHLGIAKFSGVPGLDLAAQLGRHGLHAIANAQHGNTQLKHSVWGTVVDFVHAGMAARQDDAFEVAVFGKVPHPVAAHVTGMDFAKHMGFSHATCDELGHL